MTGRRYRPGRLAPALLAGVVALGLAPAKGQHQAGPETVVVCQGGGADHCVEIDPRQLSVPAGREGSTPDPHRPPAATNEGTATRGWWEWQGEPPRQAAARGGAMPYWQPSPSDMAPPPNAYFPAAPALPAQVWLEWAPVPDPYDPGLMVPGRCARSAEAARGRWLAAARMGDLNALSAAYQWRGKRHEGAGPILDRLAGVPAAGHWEQARASAWTGVQDVRSRVGSHWRWTDGAATMHLAMREVDDCWFVEFTGDPGQVVEVAVLPAEVKATAPVQAPGSGTAIATPPGQGLEAPRDRPEAAPRRDPDNPDILVF